MIPSRGWQQLARVHCAPPDGSVRGVYIQQAAVPQVLVHTFLPGLSGAAMSSSPLHSQFINCPDAVKESADMPRPTESSSTDGRGDLSQPKQGIELSFTLQNQRIIALSARCRRCMSGAVGAQVSLSCSRAQRTPGPAPPATENEFLVHIRDFL